MTRRPAIVLIRTLHALLLLLATGAALATDDFWTLKERGELDGKPEVAYAHYFATLESLEPTVFCHVGGVPCAESGERDATPEMLAEIREMIRVSANQLFFSDIAFRNAEIDGDEATLHYTARGKDGGSVTGTVKMEKRVYGHWRVLEQIWQPTPTK